MKSTIHDALIVILLTKTNRFLVDDHPQDLWA